MGFWDSVLKGVTGTAFFSPRVTYIGGPGGLDDLAGLVGDETTRQSAAQMWRTQPHFRTVVDFLARNIAQLGIHTFTLNSETDRVRDRDAPSARALAQPNNETTTYELIYALVVDLSLYDRAFWFVGPSTATDTGWVIRRLPPAWVNPVMRSPFEVDYYLVHVGNAEPMKVPTRNVLAFPGHNPAGMAGCSPTVESLRETLREQIEASRYRGQVWRRGGRVSAVLQRPKDAPSWSDGAREAFRSDWHSKFTGNGPGAGGTPILEDGMTLNRIDFSAQEQQFVEAAKLSLTTVAAAFHVNPTMVGLLDNANYSNMREFRKMLYGDTLGPTIARIEARFNSFLLPMLGMTPGDSYLEFNIAEKLQGNFEEQAAVLAKLTGRPIFTADEGRARLNMPALGGMAAELAVPVNLALPSMPAPGRAPAAAPEPPEVTEPPGEAARALESKAGAPAVKVGPAPGLRERHVTELREFFARQGRSVTSRASAGAEWWDGERWDSELAEALVYLHHLTATGTAREALAAAGIDPAGYDESRTQAFLTEAARRAAESINTETHDAAKDALEGDEPSESLALVFDDAVTNRAELYGLTLTTFASGFGAVEAARQRGGEGARKTWRTTSSNPRSTHAALNGQTVPIGEPFSNGLQWPGGSGGDASEIAGCECQVDITF